MNIIRSLASVFALILSTSTNATMIISEYVEGSSFNKAIEIYNFGGDVNFASDQYAIEVYSNGSVTASFTISLSGVVAQNSTFVIGHSKSDSAIQSAANQLTGKLNFNGDDAVVLLHNDTVIDSIGQIGFDPGSEWGVAQTSTQNNSLRRLPDVLSGDQNALDGFEPALQWTGFVIDSFADLGQHTINQPIDVSISLPVKDSAVPVPEPGIFWLMLIGVLGLFNVWWPVSRGQNIFVKKFKSLPMSL